jgi:hypothetical protein
MAVWWVLVPLSIMLVAWQPVPLVPTSGVDPSWGAGLEMALHDVVPFGTQTIFTYGPLGFLSVSILWFSHLGGLSFAYLALTRFGLAAVLFLGARRSFGGLAAFGIAAVVASVDDQLIEMVLAVIVAVWGVVNGLQGRRALVVAAAMGAFAGMQVLDKQSSGISIAVTTALLVVGLPGRRREYGVTAAAAFALALVIGWLAAGQDLSALPDYVTNTVQVVSGYAAAMGLEVPGLGWQYTAAFIALGLGVWAGLNTTSGGTTRQRGAVVALWVTFWFFAFKEGFVRHDPIHGVYFFDAVLGGFLAFRWRPEHRVVALLSIAALLAFALAAQAESLTGDFDPSRNISTAFDELRTVTSNSERNEVMAAGRRAIEATEPVDPASLALLQGHTAAVYPSEIALAWAYHFDWDPLPVLQSYVAYTTSLDELDAGFLASGRAPQRMLVQAGGGIDGRVQSFDEPMTSRTRLCRYRVLHYTAQFAVLGLGPARCGAESLLTTVHAAWGQSVPVPRPPDNHSLVFVRIHGVGIGGLERVTALLYKPAIRYVILNGGTPQRLVTGTALDGLPLRASVGVDFPPPFNVASGASTIAVVNSGRPPHGGRPLTYSFYSQAVSAP